MARIRSFANAAADEWVNPDYTMTKIVCTMGPSTDKPGPVSDLVVGIGVFYMISHIFWICSYISLVI